MVAKPQTYSIRKKKGFIVLQMAEKAWGNRRMREKNDWISTLKIQKPVHVLCTASELVRGEQAPNGLTAGGASSKQYTRKELSREAKGAHTWDSHPVQETGKWTPSPCCSLFLMTLYSHDHSVQQLNHRETEPDQQLSCCQRHRIPWAPQSSQSSHSRRLWPNSEM